MAPAAMAEQPRGGQSASLVADLCQPVTLSRARLVAGGNPPVLKLHTGTGLRSESLRRPLCPWGVSTLVAPPTSSAVERETHCVPDEEKITVSGFALSALLSLSLTMGALGAVGSIYP